MSKRPPPSFRGRHSTNRYQNQHGHKRGRDNRDEGSRAYRHPRLSESISLQERIDRALEREAYEFARSKELDIQLEHEKDVLQSFGITDLGPELENLDIAAVVARNIAERERKQATLEAAADAEGQSTKTEIAGMIDTKGGSADARGYDSAALEAQPTKVANAADEATEKENSAQGLQPVDISDAQQSRREDQRDQAMKAEFDELLRPLRQSLGEALDQ